MTKKPVPQSKRLSRSDRNVVVRMYNVGFGDSFLILFPTPKGQRKILVDCGSIAQAEQAIGDIAHAIVRDVTDEDKVPRIDLVIATHRHKDHVSGFANPIWECVEVREVWMPWTEDPKDPDAKSIRETQSKLAIQLTQALTALGTDQAILDLANNALTNEDAMSTLHRGFSGNPKRRFLPGRKRDTHTLYPDALPGVTVHILGPSHDKEVIKDMDPPVGQSYLRLIGSNDPQAAAPKPFNNTDWSIEQETYSGLYPNLALKMDDMEYIKEAGQGLAQAVALALDKAVNGTSLMLMFQIGKAFLLFPGDAQWGTWQAALKDPEWNELMKKTVFYKIGHHGSHNATPIEFVEKMLGGDFWAMASVKPVAKWKSIPKKGLMEALTQRSKKVVRSDKAKQGVPPGFTLKGDVCVEAKIPI